MSRYPFLYSPTSTTIEGATVDQKQISISILFFTLAIKYTPLPTAFSIPYNISDVFPQLEGGID